MRIFLIFLFLTCFYFPVSASQKGTLETLILTWDVSRKGCETASDPIEKSHYCIMKDETAKTLKSKGFCEGEYDFIVDEEVDFFKDDPELSSKYKIFQKLVRHKWIPCLYETFLENPKDRFVADEDDRTLEWLVQQSDGTFAIDVNKIILRELNADQDCRGGNTPEVVFAGCSVRDEIFKIMKNYGICRGAHNYPQILKEIAGQYVWWFRHKWVPCLYSFITGESLGPETYLYDVVNLNDLDMKDGLFFEKETFHPFDGFVLDTDERGSGAIKEGKKHGIWRYFDVLNKEIKAVYFENGLKRSESKKPTFDMLEKAKAFYPDRCEWDRSMGRYHTINFGDSEFFAVECIYGSYNAWYVYLERKNDGSYLPISFSYPLIDYTYSEDGYISSSKLVGLKTVFALCNPDYDLDKMTIQTFCKGRGIGDVASYGLWKLQQDEDNTGLFNRFILKKFEDDITLDEKKNPVTIFEYLMNPND